MELTHPFNADTEKHWDRFLFRKNVSGTCPLTHLDTLRLKSDYYLAVRKIICNFAGVKWNSDDSLD